MTISHMVLQRTYRLQFCHTCEYGSVRVAHKRARTISSRVSQLFHQSQIKKVKVHLSLKSFQVCPYRKFRTRAQAVQTSWSDESLVGGRIRSVKLCWLVRLHPAGASNARIAFSISACFKTVRRVHVFAMMLHLICTS